MPAVHVLLSASCLNVCDWLALDNIRRRALLTSACFRNLVMSRGSGPRVFKDKTADWICWREDTVNFFPSRFRLSYLIPKQS